MFVPFWMIGHCWKGLRSTSWGVFWLLIQIHAGALRLTAGETWTDTIYQQAVLGIKNSFKHTVIKLEHLVFLLLISNKENLLIRRENNILEINNNDFVLWKNRPFIDMIDTATIHYNLITYLKKNRANPALQCGSPCQILVIPPPALFCKTQDWRICHCQNNWLRFKRIIGSIFKVFSIVHQVCCSLYILQIPKENGL